MIFISPHTHHAGDQTPEQVLGVWGRFILGDI